MACVHIVAPVALLWLATGVSAVTLANGDAVTPVEKVAELVQGMITKVSTEGEAEAKSYSEFACFCKDMTVTKSKTIQASQDKIEELSGTIEDDTAKKANDQEDLQKNKKKVESLNRELDEKVQECEKETAKYDSESQDLESGLTGTRAALKVLKETQATTTASLLQSDKDAIRKSLALAQAFKVVGSQRTSVNTIAFLQQGARVDPNDPDYKSHTGEIIEMLEKILSFLEDKKKDLDAEWTKTNAACTGSKKALGEEIELTTGKISKLDATIFDLTKSIAQARSDLVDEEANLKDDRLYLKDMTNLCQKRANDWDQRTLMRSDELKALKEVSKILSGAVSSSDSVVERALLQQKADSTKTGRHSLKATSTLTSRLISKPTSHSSSQIESPVSLLQEVREVQEAERNRAAQILMQEGQRLGSLTLSALAMKVREDPFKKVKKIIQDLIERLLAEALAETTKKGFCDKELSEAEKNRDYALEKVKKLDADVQVLEVKEKELVIEIEQLTKDIEDLQAALEEARETREKEKEDNMETIQTSKEGLQAITKCIIILESFYRKAAKALIEVRASPVDEDAPGAPEGSYKGAQAESKGVIGMMEVIQTDFDRQMRRTQEQEKAAQREYVKFERASSADLAGKEQKQELDKEDLATTAANKKSKMADMQDQMDLLDSTLKQIEDLKPMCIDTGMSYADRVAAREKEIAALKKAFCILDPDSVDKKTGTEYGC